MARESCSAEGARPRGAALDAQPPTPEQLTRAPDHGGQQEQGRQEKERAPEPTKEHGEHSVGQFPAPSQTKVEAVSEIK